MPAVAPVDRSQIRLPSAARIRRRPRSDSRAAAWALLTVGALAVWLAFWPGLISPDSNQTIYQAQTDLFTDWWTPFGAWALRHWTHAGLGLGTVFAVGVAVMVAGAYLCARFCLARVPAALVTLVICLIPPVYGDLSGLSRDLFFLAFTFMGFGLFGRLIQSTGRMRRSVFGAGAVVCETLAFLCRQNAIACVFALMLGLALWWTARAGEADRRFSRLRIARSVGLAVLATVFIGLAVRETYSLTGVRAVHPERFTYVYDLASISVLSGHDRFPTAIVDKPHPGWVSPPYTRQAYLDRLFDPANVITLYPGNAAGRIDFTSAAIAGREQSLLKNAWLKAATSEPLDYAWGRIRLLAIQLGLWKRPTDAYLPLLDPQNFGHPLAFPGNYRFASRVLDHFVGPSSWLALDIPWTWLLLILGVSVALVRLERRAAWFFVLLPLAVLANYGALLFAGMAAGFRYVSFEVPVALLLTAYLLAMLAARRERWSGLVEPRYRLFLAGDTARWPVEIAEPMPISAGEHRPAATSRPG